MFAVLVIAAYLTSDAALIGTYLPKLFHVSLYCSGSTEWLCHTTDICWKQGAIISLPEYEHRIGWMILNFELSRQSLTASSFRCPLGTQLMAAGLYLMIEHEDNGKGYYIWSSWCDLWFGDSGGETWTSSAMHLGKYNHLRVGFKFHYYGRI